MTNLSKTVALPRIIQGGMGVGVSNWRLAQAVSKLGQLGVVSGTALDQLMIRRLADGEDESIMRKAFDAFPFKEMAQRIWQEYFVAGGKALRNSGKSYPSTPMHQLNEPRKLVELCIVSNFLEVFLARQGHDNPVGINYLEKVQTVHLPSIYGAMLAGVGYVLMGAGIPLHIPGVLDAYAAQERAQYKLAVTGAPADFDSWMHFDPSDYAEGCLPKLSRPRFLAIVSSNTLAATLLKRANGRVDGFVVETQTAGGHNAPPRGKLQLSAAGEPIYGERDKVNLESLRALEVPFWLAGGFGNKAKLTEALAEGAAGVQIGTAFEFAEESGLESTYKRALLAGVSAGDADVFTDPLASPTGFPFKVAMLPGTLSDRDVFEGRERSCNLGFLREAYLSSNGRIAYRCAAEPVASYLAKGGKLEDTVGRKCLCNALLANIGYPQTIQGSGDLRREPALITAGDDLGEVAQFLRPVGTNYSAADVVTELLGPEDGTFSA